MNVLFPFLLLLSHLRHLLSFFSFLFVISTSYSNPTWCNRWETGEKKTPNVKRIAAKFWEAKKSECRRWDPMKTLKTTTTFDSVDQFGWWIQLDRLSSVKSSGFPSTAAANWLATATRSQITDFIIIIWRGSIGFNSIKTTPRGGGRGGGNSRRLIHQFRFFGGKKKKTGPLSFLFFFLVRLFFFSIQSNGMNFSYGFDRLST